MSYFFYLMGLVNEFHFVSDIMELKRMMEKLGQAKTHLELKKMIAEVDTTNSGLLMKHELVEQCEHR